MVYNSVAGKSISIFSYIFLNFVCATSEIMCIEIKIEFLLKIDSKPFAEISRGIFCVVNITRKQSQTICNRLEKSIRLQAFPTSGRARENDEFDVMVYVFSLHRHTKTFVHVITLCVASIK